MVEYCPTSSLWPSVDDVDSWVALHKTKEDIERMMRIVKTLTNSTLFCADKERFFVVFTCEMLLLNKDIALSSLQPLVHETVLNFEKILKTDPEQSEYFKYFRKIVDLEYINAAKRRYIAKVLGQSILGSELADKIVQYLWV